MKTKGNGKGVLRIKPTQAEVKQHNQETYGEKIRKFRQRVGMSADELADRLPSLPEPFASMKSR